MPTRSSLATAAVAFSCLALAVRGDPCDWNFTVNGVSSAYACSAILQPDGPSLSSTEGSCLCADSSPCEYDATRNTADLVVGAHQTGGNERVAERYGTTIVPLPGPVVTKIADAGYFEVTPIPGPTTVQLYSSPLRGTEDVDQALCTKAEAQFAHARSLVNGVGCVGMAGHVEITTLNDEFIAVGLAEYDFECSAGVLPTCQANCAVTGTYGGITF